MCILVVEDDEVLGQVILRRLKRLGLRADLAACGKEAVEKFKHAPYGLVFMDIGLPDIDGLQATKQMKKIEQSVPIIAITAGHSCREDCLAAGMSGYYMKPVLFDEMAAILRDYNIDRCPS